MTAHARVMHAPAQHIPPALAKARPHAFIAQPLLVQKPWGGHRLSNLGAGLGPTSQPVGEAWLVADLPGGQSAVATGLCQGLDLGQVREHWGEDFCGSAFAQDHTPLLVKLIDARESLSVQVHPGGHANHRQSKEESWVILHTQDRENGGAIYRGLKPGVNAATLQTSLKNGGPENLLNLEQVFPGDVADVPAGTVHAILGGVTLLEVQQPCDVTYRLYDHDRPRPLQVQEGLSALLPQPPPPLVRAAEQNRRLCSAPWGATATLVQKPAYRMERLLLTGSLALPPTPHTLRVVVLTRGSARVSDGAGGSFLLLPWRALVVPAAAGGVMITSADAEGVVVGASTGPLLGV